MKYVICSICLLTTLSCSQPQEPAQTVSDSPTETSIGSSAGTDSDANPAASQVTTTKPSSTVAETPVASTNQSSTSESSASILAEAQAPVLQSVFSDNFLKDTRADYTITGDVSWEAGKLTLAEGASIERAINGGSWAKVELSLQFPELGHNRSGDEFQVWFALNGATQGGVQYSDWFVRLRIDAVGSRSLEIIDTYRDASDQVVRDCS